MANEILKVIPTIQSAALAQHTLKFAKKKKKTTGDFIESAGTTIVGSALIKEESDFLKGF